MTIKKLPFKVTLLMCFLLVGLNGFSQIKVKPYAPSIKADGHNSPKVKPKSKTPDVGQIVGGEIANISQVPWQVSLQSANSGNHFCGGTIISNKYIYSAAHCLEFAPAEFVRIRAGFSNQSDSMSIGVVRKVKRIILHPMYNLNRPYDYDFALLELEDTLPIGQSMGTMKAVLPVSPQDSINGLDAPGVLGTVSGWGSLEFQGEGVDSLRVASLPIVSVDSANAPNRYDGRITPAMLPAGFLGVGGVDACQGDSGGPFVVPDGNGGFKLAGITSWGDGCAEPNFPGLWSRVSSGTSFLQMAQTAPSNDNCSTATNLTPGNKGIYLNIGASGSDLDNDCNGFADDDIWFKFTATDTSHLLKVQSINPFNGNSNFISGNPVVSIFGGTVCDSTSTNVCSDFSNFDKEEILISGLIVGNQYSVRIYDAAPGIGGGAFEVFFDTLKNLDYSFTDFQVEPFFPCDDYLNQSSINPIKFTVSNLGKQRLDSIAYAIRINGTEVFRGRTNRVLEPAESQLIESPYQFSAFNKFNQAFLVEVFNVAADNRATNDTLTKEVFEQSAPIIIGKLIDSSVCFGEPARFTYRLDSTTPATQYSIYYGKKGTFDINLATTDTFNLSGPGVYQIYSVSFVGECFNVIETEVKSILPKPQFNSAGIISQCGNQPITLMAAPGYARYRWSTGDTTQSIVVTSDGSFSYQGIDANGCLTPNSDLATVYFRPVPEFAISENKFCKGTPAEIKVKFNNSVPVDSAEFKVFNTLTDQNPVQTLLVDSTGIVSSVANLTKDTTFYIEAMSFSTSSIGVKDINAGTSFLASTDLDKNGLIFNVTDFVEIDSVTVNLESIEEDEDLRISILKIQPNGIDSLIETKSFGSETGIRRLGLNFFLSPGTYRISAEGSDAFMTSHLGINYPFTTPNKSFEIIGNSNPFMDRDVYFFFYDFKVTSLNCANERTAVTFDVITPDAPVLDSAYYACGSDSIWLKANTPTGSIARWSTGVFADSIKVGAGNYKVFFVTTGDKECESALTNTKVVSLVVPKAAISTSASSICFGDSTWVRVTNKPADAVVEWNNGSIGDSIAAKGGLIFAKIIQKGVCSGDTTGTTITVKQTPTAQIAFRSVQVCEGDSIALRVTNKPANATILWSNGATTDSVWVKTSAPLTAKFILDGCTGEQSQPSILVVNELPIKPLLSGPSNFCAKDSAVVRVTNPVAGVVYSWSNGTIGDSTKIGSTLTLKVVATSQSNCLSVSDTLRLTASPTVPRPIIEGDTSFCQGEGGILYVTNKPAGATVVWSNNQIGDTLNVNTPGSYSATFTGVTCVEGPSSGWLISSVTLPTPTFTTNIDPVTGNRVLTAVNTFGYPFAWVRVTVDSVEVISDDTNFVALPGINTYVLVIVDTLSGCGELSLPQTINHLSPATISKSIKLYPNPAQNEVRFDFPEGIEITQIKLHSITGQVIKEETGANLLASDRTIKLDDISAGYYRVSIQSNGIWVNQSLVIKR